MMNTAVILAVDLHDIGGLAVQATGFFIALFFVTLLMLSMFGGIARRRGRSRGRYGGGA